MTTFANRQHIKSIAERLYVHIDRPEGVRLVGELDLDDTAPGGFSARFRYRPEWIESANSFPVDPINLPLSNDWFQTTSRHIHLGVLFDAGPDMWGRRVLRESQLGTTEEPAERDVLLMGRGNGVGALLFALSPNLNREDLPSFITLPTIEDDLEQVHQAAHGVFSKTPPSQEQRVLLAGSWSMGGARAKAVMRDKDGRIWIVKFSEPGDHFDRQRGEMANLLMAKAIGLQVPDIQIRDTSLGSALMVERFDRAPQSLSRLHYASAIALVSAEPEDKRLTSARDRAIFSYARIADIISRISPNPAQERQELFARMVLNVCVRNTDDHLKNIGFVESGRQMRLSHVFDVVTQQQAQHYLTIGIHGRVGSIENALSEPRKFGLSAKGAQSIVDHVVEVVARRNDFYDEVGLTSADAQALNQAIGDRCPLSHGTASRRDRHR